MGVVLDNSIGWTNLPSGATRASAAYYAPWPEGHFALHDTEFGSGGTCSYALRPGASAARIVDRQSVLSHLPEPPLLKVLNQIEKTFGLNRAELARVCGTTRKSVYAWADGNATPHARNLQRLFELQLLARDWREAGFPNERARVHEPILDDRSVFDLLCDKALDPAQVRFAGSRLTLAHMTSTQLSDPFF